jgi:hypothetical protein
MDKENVLRAGRNGLESLSFGGRIFKAGIATVFLQMATS